MTTPKKQTNPPTETRRACPLQEVGPDIVIDFSSVAWAKLERNQAWLYFKGSAFGSQGCCFGTNAQEARDILNAYRAYLRGAN